MTMLGNQFKERLSLLTSEIDDAIHDDKLTYKDHMRLKADVEYLLSVVSNGAWDLDRDGEQKEESSEQEDDAKAWQANQLANKLKDAECAISGHKNTIELQNEQLNKYQGEIESLIRTVESLVGEAHDHYLKEEKRRRRLCDLLHIPVGIEWDAIEARMEEVFGSTAEPKEESQRNGIKSEDTFAVCHYRYEIRKILDLAPDTSWKTVVEKIGKIQAGVADRIAETVRLKVELNKLQKSTEQKEVTTYLDQRPCRELIASMLISTRRTMRFLLMLENAKDIHVDPSEYVGMRIQLKIMEDAATRAGY